MRRSTRSPTLLVVQKRRRLVLIAGVLVMLASVAGLALAYPAVAATTCPRCYGLVPVADGVYAERDLTAAQQDHLIALAADAGRRVGDFHGGRESAPRLLACHTAACYDRIGGGGERGMAVLNRAVILSPRGLDAVIAAHELSHVELHHRLGPHAERVPQWFDEGLAVVVSDDPRYLLPASSADRCRVASDEPLPVTLSEWLTAAGADEQTYAKAACRVSRWLSTHGDRAALPDLIARLDRGEPFA